MAPTVWSISENGQGRTKLGTYVVNIQEWSEKSYCKQNLIRNDCYDPGITNMTSQCQPLAKKLASHFCDGTEVLIIQDIH